MGIAIELVEQLGLYPSALSGEFLLQVEAVMNIPIKYLEARTERAVVQAERIEMSDEESVRHTLHRVIACRVGERRIILRVSKSEDRAQA